MSVLKDQRLLSIVEEKVPSDGVIHFPTFWDGLVNPEDMSISLTPIGTWQELFVKEIDGASKSLNKKQR